jgi:hypothetical protein
LAVVLSRWAAGQIRGDLSARKLALLIVRLVSGIAVFARQGTRGDGVVEALRRKVLEVDPGAARLIGEFP